MAPLTLFNEGGTRPFSNMWRFSLVFLYGSPCIRQWYGTLLLGLEILAPRNAIDVCASRHQSAWIGGDGNLQSPQGRLQPEDFWPLEHMSESRRFLAKQERKTSSELRAKRYAHGGRSKERSDEVMGRPPRICSVEQHQITK